MNAPSPHAEDTFDRLLAAMPQIAEAVNAFTSEKNQRAALRALVSAAGLADEAPTAVPMSTEPSLSVVPPLPKDEAGDDDHSDPADDAAEPQSTSSRKPRARKAAAAKKSYTRVKDINFRPEGKLSLRDFVDEKKPSTFHEKNLVFVYYLQEILDITAIELGHVLAAYDEADWKSPKSPDNSLMVTASQKNWLSTSDMKAISITHSGRNAVQYDMPMKDNKSA